MSRHVTIKLYFSDPGRNARFITHGAVSFLVYFLNSLSGYNIVCKEDELDLVVLPAVTMTREYKVFAEIIITGPDAGQVQANVLEYYAYALQRALCAVHPRISDYSFFLLANVYTPQISITMQNMHIRS
jgi:hypothetical protein